MAPIVIDPWVAIVTGVAFLGFVAYVCRGLWIILWEMWG